MTDISPWGKHPKMEILMIAKILAGDELDYPKGASKAKGKAAKTIAMELGD